MAWPGVLEAPALVASWTGRVTVTCSAALRPPAQTVMRMSVGPSAVPGRRVFPSLVGARLASTAVLEMPFRIWLCLKILSPPVPQQRAWSPMMSLGARQAGQGPAEENKGRPRQNLAAVTNSSGLRGSPRAGRGVQLSHSPVWGRETEASLDTSRSSAVSMVWVKRRRWLARFSFFWVRPVIASWVTASTSPMVMVREVRMAEVRSGSG